MPSTEHPGGEQRADIDCPLPVSQAADAGRLATTETLPSVLRRVARMSGNSVWARTIGECVDTQTWESYSMLSDCTTVSMARGWMPFSGSSVTSSRGMTSSFRNGTRDSANTRSVPSDSPEEVTR